MEENQNELINSCSFAGVSPIMVDLPTPPIQVREKNPAYANLLSIDYCGAVSEMSAVAQYIHDENCMACERCPMARTILGIAIAEMIHLQRLSQLIVLLGGRVNFTAAYGGGRQKMWTPGYLKITEHIGKMLANGIEAERETIRQYRQHIKMINDDNVNAVLERIIKDEEYHIMLLEMLMRE